VSDYRIDRRRCLQTLAGLGLTALSADGAAADENETAARDRVLRILETQARPDGGYGWPAWDRSHLTPTFAVIGCYKLLGAPVPRPAALATYVRAHHPLAIKKLEHRLPVFDYQQIQSLLWLGEDVSGFRNEVSTWTGLTDSPVRYEEHGDPPFQLQVMVLLCRELLGQPVDAVTPKLVDFILERRRPNGSFNQVRAAEGGDGHVMHTWHGLQALRALGKPLDRRKETIRWLQSCQLPSGGFTYAPDASVGRVDDIAYTRAAVRALKLLDAAPRDVKGVIGYLTSFGGLGLMLGTFGDRQGWDFNAVATYYGLDTLMTLGGLTELLPTRNIAGIPRLLVPRPDWARHKVFTIQIQAPGNGSPADAVELARSLGIHLWGAKNAKPGWIEAAQRVADRRKVPVTFFMADEEYGTHISIPGLGDYNHVSDVLAAPRSEPGPSLAGKQALSWSEFRDRRLAALKQAGGFAYWQFGDNEEFARAVLDESVENGGYAAISTFHFGNPDFTNSEPWLNRYHGMLPFIALQDAHGGESWWWSDNLAGFRTVFIAEEPTWNGWLKAMKNNWVAAVRHDAVSSYQTWQHGTRHVLRMLDDHPEQWRWWGEQPNDLRRPWALLTVLHPGDPFEVGAPERGLAVRLRCWWTATNQGVPKQERVRLVSLSLDGEKVEPTAIQAKNPQGVIVDRYHLFSLPNPKPGPHIVVAQVERLDNGAKQDLRAEFIVS
jgi:hypothetical protein